MRLCVHVDACQSGPCSRESKVESQEPTACSLQPTAKSQ